MTDQPKKIRNGRELYCDWMRETGRKGVWVATKLGVTPERAATWRSGATRPSLEHADALEELTDGAVPADAW